MMESLPFVFLGLAIGTLFIQAVNLLIDRRHRPAKMPSKADVHAWNAWYERVLWLNGAYAQPIGYRLTPDAFFPGIYDLRLYEPVRGGHQMTLAWRTIKPDEADRMLAQALGRLLRPLDEDS